VASIALLLLMTVAVYAGDDGNSDNNGHHYGKADNPGHHYGQLKHKEAPPPSTQTPPPSATQTQTPPATPPAGAGPASGSSGASDPAAATNAGAADPPATVPVSNLQPARVIAKSAPPTRDWVSWLVLLILPALLVVWLMVFARAALTAVRRRRVTQAA
jgi:hypothetical protein